MRYIDTHVHIGKLLLDLEPITPDGLLHWMDEHDVERVVLLPLESPESSTFLFTSDVVLDHCAAHPDRFLPFCVLDPRALVTGRREEYVRRVVREYLDRGCLGFGEVKCGLPFDHEWLQLQYAICDEFELPLVFHIDRQRCTDLPGLPRLEAMLAKYPRTKFIGHAQGFWANLGGDCREDQMSSYPTGPVAPGGAVERLLTAYPNLYADLSAGSGYNAMRRDLAHAQGFMQRCSHKLLFATDYMYVGQPTSQFKLLDRVELTADQQHAIARGNAERVLGLD